VYEDIYIRHPNRGINWTNMEWVLLGDPTLRIDMEDTFAPKAPIDLTITPEGWSDNDTFTLNWINPVDSSGIAGAYYKIGSPPTSATDGTYVPGEGITSLNITVSEEGVHEVYLWLQDGGGNVNCTFMSMTYACYGDPPQDPIILELGWNLISINKIRQDDNLSSVLEEIEGQYDAVQWFDISDKDDPWKHHKVEKPFGNDLHKLNLTMGFFIHITDPSGVLFDCSGSLPYPNQSVPIKPGWNLVGFPALGDRNRTEGLNNLKFGADVDCIQWYDAATQTWHFLEEDDSFVRGKGYWMHSNVKKIWEVM
jgi:hypothetical protein